ncbi:MAG: N-acetyltransferase [Deltaproteobacteria bacterium]|nr:MAG: N-acetyltransferase [Deltaproteobacteria bacterium]
MDIRIAANEDERRAAIAVAHAANGVRSPLATYTALRLAISLRRRARWWVLETGGGIVASLLDYPIVFGLGAQRMHGFGLGSVATHPGHRHQGLASRLCTTVADARATEGADHGLLFSAVAPAFYERLGYRVVEAVQWRVSEPASVQGPRAELLPIDPVAELGMLAETYEHGHAGLFRPRDEGGWLRTLEDNPVDTWFAVPGGYLRLNDADGELEIAELFAEDPSAVVRAVCDLAAVLGRTVVSWVDVGEPDGVPRVAESRDKTLPMVRNLPPEGARFWGADYF